MIHDRRMSCYQFSKMSHLVLIVAVFLSAAHAAVLPEFNNKPVPSSQQTTTDSDLITTTALSPEEEDKFSPVEEEISPEQQDDQTTSPPHFIQEFRKRSHMFTSSFGTSKIHGLPPLGEDLIRSLGGKPYTSTEQKTRNKPSQDFDRILWAPAFSNTSSPPPATTSPTVSETKKPSKVYSPPRDKILSHITLVLQKNSSMAEEDRSTSRRSSGVSRIPFNSRSDQFTGRQPFTGDIYVSRQGNIDLYKHEIPVKQDSSEDTSAHQFDPKWLLRHFDALSRSRNPPINFSNPGIADFLSMVGMGMLMDIAGTNKTLE